MEKLNNINDIPATVKKIKIIEIGNIWIIIKRLKNDKKTRQPLYKILFDPATWQIIERHNIKNLNRSKKYLTVATADMRKEIKKIFSICNIKI